MTEQIPAENIRLEPLSEEENETQPSIEDPTKNDGSASKWPVLATVAKALVKWKRPETEEDRQRKWLNRRLRLARKYGGLKEDTVDSSLTRPPIFKKPSVFEYAKQSVSKRTDEGTKDFVDSSSAVIDAILDRDETPREYGVGLTGELLNIQYNDEPMPTFVRHQMDQMEDYRPYFSYWLTTVQIVIMIITLCWYSISTIGVELKLKSDFVFTESLTYQQVAFYEPTNFWIGPRPADVIHLGSVFAGCMRPDAKIEASTAQMAAAENEQSGCCVRNDHSGCLQTTKEQCSPLLSTFYKWTQARPGPNGRIHGPVCGQDPSYCENPLSKDPFQWPDDLRQWPVCQEATTLNDLQGVPAYLECSITAKPCCIGIHGRCEMRSSEYCKFVGGHFHPEASLCSQVSCMQDVCGMLPFLKQGRPDQVYRLWTALFLHAGLIHLAITVLVQYFIMRDLERLIGPWRMAVLYFGSGK